MIKTLKNSNHQEREKFKIPKSAQQAVPIQIIYPDGIFGIGKNKYSKTFRFTDINYAVAGREDKEAMFLEYSELLNSFDSGATTKLTINNRRLNRAEFEKSILIPMKEDGHLPERVQSDVTRQGHWNQQHDSGKICDGDRYAQKL